jgi:hypothetical protein
VFLDSHCCCSVNLSDCQKNYWKDGALVLCTKDDDAIDEIS